MCWPRLGKTILAAFALVAVVDANCAAADCPSSTVYTDYAPPEQISGAAASGSRSSGNGFAGGWFSFQEYAQIAEVSFGSGGSIGLTARGRYRFLGLWPGTRVSNQVQVKVTGYLSGTPIGMPCSATSSAQFILDQDQLGILNGTWQNQPEEFPGDRCSRGIDATYEFTCSHPIGTEFELASTVNASGAEFGSAHVKTTLAFGSLPPGAFMARCDGDTTVHVLDAGPGTTSALGIAGIWPNPSRGEFHASLSLAVGGPAIVRLMDLSGRVVESRICDASSHGERTLSFGRSLAPGLYFLKVSQGAVTAVREVVIRR
ncbi:MAG: T9SS type A sorting domain-containing protein [Candidatus Eisenbacteria bacterium]